MTHVDYEPPFRRATVYDCPAIAQMLGIASDGVAPYVWSLAQSDHPGLTLEQIGAMRYSDPAANFSYKNTVVGVEGGEVIALLLTFAIGGGDRDAPPPPDVDPVLAPYCLEEPNSWYICAMAVGEPHRGKGLGSRMLEIAQQQATAGELATLSLLCFEENTEARRLYERRGYNVVARRPIVPHPLIHVSDGDILLMTRSVSGDD